MERPRPFLDAVQMVRIAHGFWEIVLHRKNGEPLPFMEIGEQLVNFILPFHVNPCGWFIQNKKIRRAKERSGEEYLLMLAARERSHEPVPEGFGARHGERMHGRGRILDMKQAAVRIHHFPYRDGKGGIGEIRALRDIPDAPGLAGDAAPGGRQKSKDEAHKRGFSASIFTKYRNVRSLGDR